MLKIDGSCHCGALSYEAQVDPETVTLCPCTDCQSLSGSAFRTVAPVRREDFRLITGEPRLYVKRGGSGAERPQAFCPTCGTQIYATGVGAAAAIIGIRLGTCRQRAQLAPRRQIWCRSAMPWIAGLGALEARPEG